MDVEFSNSQSAIVLGLVVSALNEAARDGRTGPWVDRVTDTLSALNRAENLAKWKVAPTGGEPFGTKVTFWSANWGTRHAVITSSPKPQAERDFLDCAEWGIVIRGSGMTFAPADQLTLGWHPEALGADTPAGGM